MRRETVKLYHIPHLPRSYNMAEARKRKLNDILDSHHDDSTQAKKSTCSSMDSEQKRTIGPSLPPPNDSGIIATHGNGDSDDDGGSDDIGPLKANQSSDDDSDGDDIGPILPTTLTEHSRLDGNTDLDNLEIPPKEKHTHAAKSQRDEWMLQPPDKSDWASRVDPTKLRNRTFQTGRSARAPSVADRADTSWVESQEQKIGRKRDEVLGVSAPTSGGKESYCTEAPKMTEAFQERIQKFSVSTIINWLSLHTSHIPSFLLCLFNPLPLVVQFSFSSINVLCIHSTVLISGLGGNKKRHIPAI